MNATFWLPWVLALVATGGAKDEERPLTPRERAVHVLSRFSYGPRPGDVDRVVEMGAEAWLEEQLKTRPNSVDYLDERLAEFQTLELSTRENYDFTYLPPDVERTRESARKRRDLLLLPMKELLRAVTLRAVFSDRQLDEVLCDFWRNHFNVSFTKGFPAPTFIPDYERTVISANALGDFPTMLKASAKHPAMLHYLDNYLSRRPPTKFELNEVKRKARRDTGSKALGEQAANIASQKGLNENYARELLELHTLGVDNYYRQNDVIAVAETLTGWTVEMGRKGSWEFAFASDLHVYDDRRVLGRSLAKDRDGKPTQGEALLDLLANHKGTSKFIAMKLVRYFVNDVPPPDLVKEVATTYKKSKGSVPAMIETIIESDDFWSRKNYQAKFKTPYEFVVSALRVTNAEVENLAVPLSLLERMGQPVYQCDDPTGWYDTADAWLDPGVLALRWALAQDLANDNLRGVHVPASYFDDIPQDVSQLEVLQGLIEKVLPGGAGTRTLSLLYEVLKEEGEYLEREQLLRRLLGLLLGCPEFQEQ